MDTASISDSISKRERYISESKSPISQLCFFDFALDGNAKQLRFLLELAQMGCISRPLLLNGLHKDYDSIKLAKFARILTISIGRFFQRLYSDTAQPLLTPTYITHFNNKIQPIDMTMQISIGSDLVLPDDEVSTSFFGARFSQGAGGFVSTEGLSKPYRSWLLLLVDILSRYGAGFQHHVDLIQSNSYWLSESIGCSHSALLKYDCNNVVLLKAYLDQCDDDTFDFDSFVSIHAQGLNAASNVTLSSADFEIEVGIHKHSFMAYIGTDIGCDYDSITNLVESLYEAYLICEPAGLDLNHVLDFGYPLPKDVNFEFGLKHNIKIAILSLPQPSNAMDQSISDYINKMVLLIPEMKGLDLQLETEETSIISAISIGLYDNDTLTAVATIISDADRQLNDMADPLSYIVKPDGIREIVEITAVINSLLGSIAMLTDTPLSYISNPY